eukprot:gene8316-14377_t
MVSKPEVIPDDKKGIVAAISLSVVVLVWQRVHHAANPYVSAEDKALEADMLLVEGIACAAASLCCALGNPLPAQGCLLAGTAVLLWKVAAARRAGGARALLSQFPTVAAVAAALAAEAEPAGRIGVEAGERIAFLSLRVLTAPPRRNARTPPPPAAEAEPVPEALRDLGGPSRGPADTGFPGRSGRIGTKPKRA